jgi:hypothetical protein
MRNWHSLQGKFTDEEYAIIEKHLKKHNIPKNQIVRKAIGFLIPLENAKDSITSSNFVARKFFIGIKKIVSSPDYVKKCERLLEDLYKKYPHATDEFVELFSHLDKDFKAFSKKHAPRGRPPIKRKRGRPRE